MHISRPPIREHALAAPTGQRSLHELRPPRRTRMAGGVSMLLLMLLSLGGCTMADL